MGKPVQASNNNNTGGSESNVFGSSDTTLLSTSKQAAYSIGQALITYGADPNIPVCDFIPILLYYFYFYNFLPFSFFLFFLYFFVELRL
jgi:hypothetical protein